MGVLSLPSPYRPPTLEERIARYYSGDDVAGRLVRSLADAKHSYQQVLIIAADQQSDTVRQFFQVRYDYSQENLNLRRALSNYILVGFEHSQIEHLQPYGIAAGGREETIHILQPPGKPIAHLRFDDVMRDGKLDRKALLEFLKRQSQQAPLPDAQQEYLSALEDAKQQGKRVFVQVSGPGCAPCILLSRFIDAQKTLFTKEYVYLKLDSRMPRAEGVIGQLRKGAEGGIPWMVILDAEGKPLITSDSDEGNIGFPQSESEKSHFERMIRTTARNLSAKEITALLKGLGSG